MEKGYSRVPLYYEQPKNIIGLVLVKNLLTINPADEAPVKDSTIRRIPSCNYSPGSSNVSRRVTSKSRRWSENYDQEVLQINDKSLSALTADGEVIGIITMEDVIEELLNEEIYDETDRCDNNS